MAAGEISVHVEGLGAFLTCLDELTRRGKDQTPVWRTGAQILHDRKEQVFATEGGRDPWKPRAASTLKQILAGAGLKGSWEDAVKRAAKRKRATSRFYTKILVRKGDAGGLKGSDTTAYWRTGCEIGSNLRYARIHQLGGWTGKGHKVYIPARPHLQVDPADLTELGLTMIDYLGAAFTEVGSAPRLRVG